MPGFIRWFDEIGMSDIVVVGGKNASLGEMRTALTPLGIRTPDEFATTADGYPDSLLKTLVAIVDVERRQAGLKAAVPETTAAWAAPC